MWRQQDAAALRAERVFVEQKEKPPAAVTPPSRLPPSPFPLRHHSLRPSHSAKRASQSVTIPPHIHTPKPCGQNHRRPGFSQQQQRGALGSSIQKRPGQSRGGDQATRHCSQLEAVAMAFLSCWLRISRVRDSSSRSWQVLQTSTGSYSCWSGMGSFR